MKFDPKRATRVYGSSMAAFFQDGVYFNGDGQEISHEEAAKENPDNVLPVAEPESTELPSATNVTKAGKRKNPIVIEASGVTEAPVDNPSPANWKQEQELRDLHVSKLQAMVDELGGPVETGVGSKKRLIEYLLQHTSVNYLELCQDYCSELGIGGGGGPSSVANQTGELKNVVRWVREGALWIDNLWRDWMYLWASTEVTVTGDSITVTGLNDVDRSSVWCNRGSSQARQLTWCEWSDMRQRKMRVGLTGLPVSFSVDPSHRVVLDRVVTALPVYVEYWRAPVRLAADTDTPLLPEGFHRLIICRAAIMYGNREAAGEIISGMEAEYIDLLEKLQSAQLVGFRAERMSTQDVPLQILAP